MQDDYLQELNLFLLEHVEFGTVSLTNLILV